MSGYTSDQLVANATVDGQMVPTGQRARITGIQTAGWTQSTTAADTGIVIPANSQITEIIINITTECDAANISAGTTSASTEVFTALAAGTAANVFKYGSTGTITDGDTWADIGSSDLPIFIDFSAGTSGVGFITVEYIQNINNA